MTEPDAIGDTVGEHDVQLGGLTEPSGTGAEIDVAELEALPTVSLLFMITGAVRNLLLTSIALFTFSGGEVTWLLGWLVVLIVPGVVGAVLRYAVFRYRLGEEELQLRDGILQRNDRHVPYDRIQNVDLVQNPLHRWLGVATVRLETASGGEAEASISVLPLAVIDDLRQRVFRHHHGETTTASTGTDTETTPSVDGRQVLTVPASELALLGLLSNKGLLVVAAAVGLIQQMGFFDDPTRFEAWLPVASSLLTWLEPGSWTVFQIATLSVVLIVGFMVAVRVLSAAWMVFTLWAFQLDRRGDDLRTRYGMLTRITATIPRRRVQLLSVRESFLQARLGRVSVQVETAGGGQAQGANEQGPGASRLWLAPMLDRVDLGGLVTEVMPKLGVEAIDWRPISARARRRVLRLHLIGVAVLTAIGLAVVGLWGLLALALAPWAWLRAVRSTSRAGWAITDDTVLYRSGPWGRSTSVVPFSKVQSVIIHQSPFDRRWGMATVDVDTAGSRIGGHRVVIPYLDVANAHALARFLSNQAARRSFRW